MLSVSTCTLKQSHNEQCMQQNEKKILSHRKHTVRCTNIRSCFSTLTSVCLTPRRACMCFFLQSDPKSEKTKKISNNAESVLNADHLGIVVHRYFVFSCMHRSLFFPLSDSIFRVELKGSSVYLISLSLRSPVSSADDCSCQLICDTNG